MAPGQDAGAGRGPASKTTGSSPWRQQVRGGGEADRAGADDGDGEGGVEHRVRVEIIDIVSM